MFVVGWINIFFFLIKYFGVGWIVCWKQPDKICVYSIPSKLNLTLWNYTRYLVIEFLLEKTLFLLLDLMHHEYELIGILQQTLDTSSEFRVQSIGSFEKYFDYKHNYYDLLTWDGYTNSYTSTSELQNIKKWGRGRREKGGWWGWKGGGWLGREKMQGTMVNLDKKK